MSDARQVLDGLAGLGVMGLALLTPFLCDRRSRWGAGDGAGAHPGDDLVPDGLENPAGRRIHDADRIHPGREAREGGGPVLHPRMPPPRIASVGRGRHMVAHAPADAGARAAGRPWAEASRLFVVERLGPARCRVVSRYRCAGSDDLRTRLSFGSALLEPIGFAMDRRMLRGIRGRVTAVAAPRGAQ